ncbi:Serine/threonine-protein phosphatase 6 regulatory subunit 3 [Aphelenchoides besseyi]|nr:Serine/threonine-protein phosphatase 6 regulatory subunit 3 [Aphelenchoides besseyi]
MFWAELEQQQGPPSLQAIVEKENVKLDEVLHHENCFQDVRVGASYVVDYFAQHDILQELLNRCIYAPPDPNISYIDQYKQSPRAMAIFAMNNAHINTTLLNDKILMDGIINYLAPRDKPYVDDVKAGYYKRIILALLSTSEETDGTFLEKLQESKFLDHCFQAIDYGAIAELLIRIPQCVNEAMQTKIFQWYADADVAKRLSSLFKEDALLDVLENTSFIWVEFDEMQLQRVDLAESFKKTLYSTDTLKVLLDAAFPESGGGVPRVINYVCPILPYYIEVNRSVNEPAFRVFPELYTRDTFDELCDPEFSLQSAILERAEQIVKLAIEYGNAPDSENLGISAAMCLKVIRYLLNTNHKPTQEKLGEILSAPDTSIIKLLEITERNPLFAIFNNHVHAIIAYSLFSNSDDKFPLVDALFKVKPNLVNRIITNGKNFVAQNGETNFEANARANFFLKLGDLINSSRNEASARASYINNLLESEDCIQSWQEMTDSTLHEFSESNRSYTVNTNTSHRTMEESLGDIDEVATMTERENGDTNKPIYIIESLETKLPTTVTVETIEQEQPANSAQKPNEVSSS